MQTLIDSGGPPQLETRDPQLGTRVQANISYGRVYEAADRRDFRGYFYLPSLVPHEIQDCLTRRAIIERSIFLEANVGAVGMVTRGLSLDIVGTGLWPKWTTSSPEFNRAMTNDFHDTCHDPRIFSADGENEVYGCQATIRDLIAIHGDCFGQLLRPSEGSSVPQFHLIPGYRVDTYGDEKPGERWVDGCLLNDLGRKIAYKVHREIGSGYDTVDAADLIHLHDRLLPGQVRGMPMLAPVAKKLFRREDILRAIANGILSREQMGYAIEMEGENTEGPGRSILPSTGAKVEANVDSNGQRFTTLRFVGDAAAESVKVPIFEKGAKLKTVESQRPATQVTDFNDSILRETAWAFGVPVEYAFFLAGGILGTFTRLVMVKVKTWICSKREFQLKPQFTNRWNVFFTWQRIKAGVFDRLKITVPKDWWRHKTHVPADISVDLGREGRLYDSRVGANQMSIEGYHNLGGEDADDVETENLEAMDRRLEKLKLLNKAHDTAFTYFDIWPRTSNAPPPQSDPEPTAPPPTITD